MQYQDIKEFIENQVTAFEEGEQDCIKSYKVLRALKKVIEKSIKDLESPVIDEVEQNKDEYLDFKVSTRKTYNYKDSSVFLEKQSELKEIESTLKIATDMNAKGDTYCDSEGNVIDPVGVKFTQVLTYNPKK